MESHPMHPDRARYLMKEIKPHESVELANLLLDRACMNESRLLKSLVMFLSLCLALMTIAVLYHV